MCTIAGGASGARIGIVYAWLEAVGDNVTLSGTRGGEEHAATASIAIPAIALRHIVTRVGPEDA